ncbi:MAG: tetratricopeptide repeat protein, partial [Acidobacteriota bacterium]
MNRRVPLGRVAAIVLAVMVAACEETLTSRQRESLLDAGDQALMEGRLDEAAQSFRRVVEAGSADARPYAGLGLAQMRSRRSREALESFQEATRRAPDNPHYAQLEAHVLATLGRTDEAITAFDRLLAKDPAQPRAAVELIDLLLASGRQKDAVAVARVA